MIKWFNGLKVAQKLALISFIFVLPDSIMLYLFITSINENIHFAKLEQVGNEYQRPLETLLELVPQQRLDARRVGAAPPTARQLSRQREIDLAFDAVAEVDARIGLTLHFTPEGLAKRNRQGCDIASVRGEWERLKTETAATANPEERDQRYLQLIDRVRGMIAHAGDMSNLILDPDLDSYYLVDVTLMALPPAQDRLARVMADGEDLFNARGEAAGRIRGTLATDLAFLKNDDLDRISDSTQTALTSENPLYGSHPSFQARVPVAFKIYADAAARFNELTARIQTPDRGGVTVEQYLSAGNAARRAAFNLWSVADEELNGILQGRINYYTYRRTRSLGVAAGAFVAALCLVTFITQSISRPLKKQAYLLKMMNDELSLARSQLEDRVVETDAALERSEQKYQKIFENAVMGIFQISSDGLFRSANPALATIFGYDCPADLVANSAQANEQLYVDRDTRALFAQLIEERGYVNDFQSEIRTRDGIKWVTENARAVRDGQGRLLYCEGTLEDITQRKRAGFEERRAHENAEEALRAAEVARAAAEAASTAKGDFLATMSHEIRTPLNGVIGMADLLAHTPLNNKQARYVGVIKSSSAGLLAIINQILDFSKIEAGKLELAVRDYDLPVAVEEVVGILAEKAAIKGLELACQIDSRVPSHVRGDDDRLRQVLLNIVNNAIKFTARGEVLVRVSLATTNAPDPADGSVALRFTVTDTGAGIPPERLDRLFQSFSQVDSSTTRQYGGTGLGLAISKQLAELMGGEIGVESTPGVGSTFWFTIKVALQDSSACATAPFTLSGRRVLLVDDSSMQCQLLQEQLRAWGIDSTFVTSATAALELLAARSNSGQPFEAAIVDLNMPGIGGLELARMIRASSILRDLPLILLSSLETESFADGHPLGHVLTKPIRQSSLLDSMMKVFVRTSGTPAQEPATTAAQAAPSPVPAAPKKARILLAEDNEVNQFVATETLARVGYPCDIVTNGREAVTAAASKAYDVILMDCQMPEMSGFEAAGAIRQAERAALPGARPIKIIALTANAIKGDRERCLAAGMDDYLTKPLDPATMLRCIESHLPTIEAIQPVVPVQPSSVEQPPTTGGTPPSGDPVIDYDDLLARCDGDKAMMGRLIQKFQQKSDQMWEDLLAGFQSGDAAATARHAHAMKGTASNLSAVKVATLAARLEELGKADDLRSAEAVVENLRIELDRCKETFAKLIENAPTGKPPVNAAR